MMRQTGAQKARDKFLRFFPEGFRDPQYLAWERDYKWEAYARWHDQLGEGVFRSLLRKRAFSEIAARAVRVESGTNLLFSFEKMALRDAVRSPAGAKAFAKGLFDFLHGDHEPPERFARWVDALGKLPRRQTRVLTWPLATVFGFLAQPERHFFLKPRVTRRAAAEYGADFGYLSKPNWGTYSRLLDLAHRILRDLRDLRPRDMIDAQSFLWVQGSEEYEERVRGRPSWLDAKRSPTVWVAR